MNIKLDHVQITVSDLKESRDWYKKAFGFNLVEWDNTPPVPYAIVALNDSMICMEEYKSRNQKSREEDNPNGSHEIAHFGIRIMDLEAWQDKIKTFKNLGVFYSCDYPNSRSWYVKDPNGHMIEVSYANGDKALRFPPLESTEKESPK